MFEKTEATFRKLALIGFTKKRKKEKRKATKRKQKQVDILFIICCEGIKENAVAIIKILAESGKLKEEKEVQLKSLLVIMNIIKQHVLISNIKYIDYIYVCLVWFVHLEKLLTNHRNYS